MILTGEPFGREPTYARRRDDRVVTARRATDLAHATDSVDVRRLCALLTYEAPLDPKASLVEGVYRVPAGGTLTFDSASTEPRVDWPSILVEEERPSPLEAADELWRRFLGSVEHAIRGKKKIAVLTGGGVDSGALLAAAAALVRGASDREAVAVALDFEGEGDDRPHLRALVADLGVTVVRVAPESAGSHVRALLDAPGLPIWSASAAADFELLRRCRELESDIVLAGVGGDDVLDGEPTLLADRLRAGDAGAVVDAWRLQVPWRASAKERLASFLVRPLLSRVLPLSLRRARRRRVQASQWPWAGPALEEYIQREAEAWAPPHISTPTARYARLARASYLADVVELCVELADRAEVTMAFPYLDPHLVSFACALPPALMLEGRRLRGLFRLGARGTLTESVRLRKDKARFAEARRRTLLAAGGIDVVADLATMTHSAALGIVDREAFASFFRRFPEAIAEDDATWTWTWPALAVEGFLRARASLRAA